MYHGVVVVQTNDPDNANLQVPVTLVVPAYQQGIDPGTGTYLDPDSGVLYAADRAFTPGGFGYVGGSTRSTSSDIAGTDRDPAVQRPSAGDVGLSIHRPERDLSRRPRVRRAPAEEGRRAHLQRQHRGQQRPRQPRRLRRGRRAAHRPRPDLHGRGHRRCPRHHLRRPARRQPDHQRHPRDRDAAWERRA